MRFPRPTLPVVSLAAVISTSPPAHRRALVDRVRTLLIALGQQTGSDDADDLVGRLDTVLTDADPSKVWLALAVLNAELPTADDVRRTARAIRLDGTAAAFSSPSSSLLAPWLRAGRPVAEVHVAVGEVLVDLEHTSRTGLATGIQRVARETARRWDRDHDVRLVGWDHEQTRLRQLQPAERSRALTGSDGPAGATSGPEMVVVPWRSTYLLPELSPERSRNDRIAAMAQFGQGRTGVIGFDCVPMTTAETTALGMSEAFATNLAAVRFVNTVSCISRAAAAEYLGWRSMLASIGSDGPDVQADVLPAEVPGTTEEALAAARRDFTVPGMPMVLCVGTHEPRKNHVALLHAAELLWRDGVQFNLVLVGGRSWNDAAFQEAVAVARARNRPVDVVTSMSDDGLWAAYRVARCVVFPSLNEGFGLPVAEALASGTPVVTSSYGSMAEIAAEGGAVLVDPRLDHDLADGLRRVLTDDALHRRLVDEAAHRPSRSWDDYARDVWDSLTA